MERRKQEANQYGCIQCIGWSLRRRETQRLKAFHAIVNDCGSLYCNPEGPKCEDCDLRRFLPPKVKLLPNLVTTCHPLPKPPDASSLPQSPSPLPRAGASSQFSRARPREDKLRLSMPSALTPTATEDGCRPSGRSSCFGEHTTPSYPTVRCISRDEKLGRREQNQSHESPLAARTRCKDNGRNSYMLAEGMTPAAIGVRQEIVDVLAAHGVISKDDVNATSHVTPAP